MADKPKRDDIPPEQPKGPGAVVDQLQTIPVERDVYSDQMAQLLSRVFDHAMENFDQAEGCGDPLVTRALLRFGSDMAMTHAKLVAARDKHLKSTIR